jgi:hypothetical protein
MISKLLDERGILAIFYQNTPLTDAGASLLEYLNSITKHQQVHIAVYEPTETIPSLTTADKMWVVSRHKLGVVDLGDVFAENWINQTMVIPNPDMVTKKIVKRPTYASGIACDLARYLSHRPEVLNSMLSSLTESNSFPFSPSRFSRGLLAADSLEPLWTFVHTTPVTVRRVVWTAFSIG